MTPTMRALVRDGTSLGVCDVPVPTPGPDEVRVRIALAGICRTDLAVAEGRLGASGPLVLGHECAGVVDAVGASVCGLLGRRVAVIPFLGCGTCVRCARGAGICAFARQLGVHVHGAFAEYVTVPAACVLPVEDAVSLARATWVEPVAAALAVLRAPLDKHANGLIYGRNRIASLTSALLAHHGFAHTEAREDPPENAYDYAVETFATEESLSRIVRALKPGGVLVLKSRPAAPVPLDVREAVARDLTIVAAGYGSFTDALRLLDDDALPIDLLSGPAHPLDDFARVFAAAREDESTKRFLVLDPSLA